MRGLFRSAVALFTVGFAMIGCNRSGSGDSAQKPIDSPYQAAFRVPGMT
jgi:hypothetical protein